MVQVTMILDHRGPDEAREFLVLWSDDNSREWIPDSSLQDGPLRQNYVSRFIDFDGKKPSLKQRIAESIFCTLPSKDLGASLQAMKKWLRSHYPGNFNIFIFCFLM